MIVAVPGVTPVTCPVEPTVTEPEPSTLLHVPPVGISLSEVTAPTHMDVLPMIADGKIATFTSFVA